MTLRPSCLRAGLLLAVLLLAGCGGGGESTGGGGSGGGGGGNAGAPLPPGTRTDRVLVRPADVGALPGLLSDLGSSLLTPVAGTRWFLVAVPPGTGALAFVGRLESDGRTAAAALDLGLSSPEGDGSTLPAGGELLSSQIPTQSELQRIGAPAARARSTGAGVRVGVIDTGILVGHAAVSGHVDPDGYDVLDDDADPSDVRNANDDDGDGLVDEEFAHGTFVASLVLAIARDARIVPFRALDADGIGTSSGVAAAITYAANRGVNVVNLSVSIPAEVQVVQEAIENARLLGLLVVASAGNTGAADANQPSAMGSALLVTAVDSGDVRPPFASTGSEVDLAAPGVRLLGAFPGNPDTARWSGTSFSAALVTGGYALVRALNPLWTPDQVVERLLSRSASIAAQNPGQRERLGRGRLDLDAATAP